MDIGFGFRTDFTRAQFSIFELGFHYHPEGDPDPCPFRVGMTFALFGFHFDVGMFNDVWE